MNWQSGLSWWESLWEERGRAIRANLGETEPPGMVLPYSWKKFILPGACCMMFGPTLGRNSYLFITEGMTQPLKRDSEPFGWEFCVRSKDPSIWPSQLLFDLLTYWLTDRDMVAPGLHLPLTFFRNRVGTICAGLGDPDPEIGVEGSIRGLYLWPDYEGLRFQVSSGDFQLLNAIAVTEDEDRLAQESTPPHLLLLLKEMGVNQVSDPFRNSVMQLPETAPRWRRIKTLSHDEAVRSLTG